LNVAKICKEVNSAGLAYVGWQVHMSEIAIRGTNVFKAGSRRKSKAWQKKILLLEELEITKALEDLKRELDQLYNQFDFTTDPALIDGCIYSIKAANSKYKFYLDRCKERKIRSG